MPAELRQISFSNAEVSRALGEFNRRCGETLPTAIAQVNDLDDQNADVSFEIGDISQRTTVTIPRQKIAAALILFCKLKSIPLPAGGSKSLSVVRGQIRLTVFLSDEARQQNPLPLKRA